jgi:peroxiredoxin
VSEPVKQSGIRKKLRSWLKSALFYGLIFLLAGFLGNLWMSRDQAVGKAPEISAQNLQGDLVSIDTATYQKPILLYFFADWCPICKVQNPVIASISKDYPVVAIAMQSGDIGNVKQYVEQQQLDLYVLNDSDGSISRSYGVHGVPASFIIDRDGDIQFSTRGYATRAGLLSRLWLTEADVF